MMAVSAPGIGLLTFPHRYCRPENPLYSHLGALIPHYEWEFLPTDCMGQPYGPADAVRTELLFVLADDLFVHSTAMLGVCLLAVVLTAVRVARARRPHQFGLWTLLTAVLSVLAWVEFWRYGLVVM